MATGAEAFFQIAMYLQDLHAMGITFYFVKIQCFIMNQTRNVNVNIVEVSVKNII
jgi:hypothetical protein